MEKNRAVARAVAGKDDGNKYVRERFCQTPDARCNREKLVSERESKETRVLRNTGDDTQRDKKTGREKSYYNHGARWREGLQPDRSRR